MNAAIETTAAIIHGLIRGFAGVADEACPAMFFGDAAIAYQKVSGWPVTHTVDSTDIPGLRRWSASSPE
jgi:hypothetical protein